jgi:hypothetical protein
MGCRLLEPGALSALLSLLCEQDMPVDLLQLLVYMSEDSCRCATLGDGHRYGAAVLVKERVKSHKGVLTVV